MSSKSFCRPFVSWVVIFSILISSVPAYAETESELQARLNAEADRITQAYASFSDAEFETMKGSSFFQRILDHAYAFLEAVPVAGEQVREMRESDPHGFSEAELDRYLSAASKTKNVEQMMNQLFRETVGFVQRVSAEESLSVDARSAILNKVIQSTSDGFSRMTAPFEDPLPPARDFDDVLSDYRYSGYWKGLAPFHYVGQWVLAQAQWVGREFTALFTGQALPIPLVEMSAERRSHSTEQLALEVRTQVRRDAARLAELSGKRGWSIKALISQATTYLQNRMGKGDTRNREQVLMSLVAMEELVKATESSEVMQHGGRNRMVRRFYIAMAFMFLYFGGPEIGPFLGWSMGFAERTLMGSVAAMVQWVTFSLWLARSRRQNSGLQYHKEVYGGAIPLIGKKGLYDEIRELTQTPEGKEFAYECHVTLATHAKSVVADETILRAQRRRH